MGKGAIIGAALLAALAGCGSSEMSAAQLASLQRTSDESAIAQIEATWHKAASEKNVDLIVSLFTENGSLTVGPTTYTGKAQLREFFATKAGPFKAQNHWISETPAYKIRVTVNGDNGTLYFECHYVDIDTHMVASVVAANDIVHRVNGRWLIAKSLTGTAVLTP
jgi:ketosteroid isomerase-like protein